MQLDHHCLTNTFDAKYSLALIICQGTKSVHYGN